MAHQREETRNRKCFVAIAENLKVYGFVIVEVTQERNDGVYRYHEKNTYDAVRVSRDLASNGGCTYCFCSYGFRKCVACRRMRKKAMATASAPKVADNIRPKW